MRDFKKLTICTLLIIFCFGAQSVLAETAQEIAEKQKIDPKPEMIVGSGKVAVPEEPVLTEPAYDEPQIKLAGQQSDEQVADQAEETEEPVQQGRTEPVPVVGQDNYEISKNLTGKEHANPYARIGGINPPSEMRGTLLSESFEEGLMPPTNWTVQQYNTWNSWNIASWYPYDGWFNAMVFYDWMGSFQDEWLISPSMDFSTSTNPVLSFWFYTSYFWTVEMPYCTLKVCVSTDGGNTFPDVVWVPTDYGYFADWTWCNAVVDLSAYAGEADVQLAFDYVGAGGADFGIDYVIVNDDPGRCCFGDIAAPNCEDISYSDCLAKPDMIGWTIGTDCTNPCPAILPGKNCGNPYPISLPSELPFSMSSTTCGMGNDHMYDGCLSSYSEGEDFIFRLDVAEAKYITITMDPMGYYYTGISLSQEGETECPGAYCMLESLWEMPDLHVLSGWVMPGVYFIQIDSWGFCTDFTLTIEETAAPLGRCCYGDPQGSMCDDITELDCINLGGKWDAGTSCAENPCFLLGTGDDCTDPIVLDLSGTLPIEEVNTTCGRGNDYDQTCLGGDDGNEDIIYRLDVAEAIDVTIQLECYQWTAWTNLGAMLISTDCPPTNDNCIYQFGETPVELLGAHFEPGSYYLMVDGPSWAQCFDSLQLTISEYLGPEPGDNCESPLYVTMPAESPFVTTDSTCGRGDYYDYAYGVGCSQYDNGPEIIYQIEVTEASVLVISLDPLGFASTGMALSSECPGQQGSGSCLIRSEEYEADPHYMEWTVEPGTYYLMIDSWSSCIPEFNLTIETMTCDIPSNNVCEDVSPKIVPMGTSLTFYGDNSCATNECPDLADEWGYLTFEDYGHTWEAFTIEDKSDLVIDLCGTDPFFNYAYEFIYSVCPCNDDSYVEIEAAEYDFTSCGDGNVSLLFKALEAGTYYYPVLGDHPDYYQSTYMEGPYTLTVTANIWDSTYCEAQANCGGNSIGRVQFSNVDNISDCSPDGYGDYTSIIGKVFQKATYTVTVTMNDSWIDNRCGIWIDWNNDRTFDDEGEQIAMDVEHGTGPFIATFTVPEASFIGQTRMRIRARYYQDPIPCDPDGYGWGEYEDYTLDIGETAPILEADPASVDFGLVDPGSTGGEDMTLSAIGGDIEYSAIVVYGTNSGRNLAGSGQASFDNKAPEKPASESGEPSVPDPNVIRQGGDDVATATPITLPYTGTGTTTGYTNDYDEACPYPYSIAPDVVYSFVATEDKLLSVDMLGSLYDTKVYVYEDNAGVYGLLACNDDYYDDLTSAFFGEYITAGRTYYIVVDGYGDSHGVYTINVWLDDLQEFVCPENSIPENELCGEDNNGGCNMGTPTFEPVNAGDTICGKAWGVSGIRDTDWFLFNNEREEAITLTASAEFPFILGFVQKENPYGPADCSNITGWVKPSVFGDPFDTVSITLAEAVASEYFLFFAPLVYDNYPCNEGRNSYWFLVTTQPRWLTLNNEEGIILEDGSTNLGLAYNAENIGPGVHNASVVFTQTGMGLANIPVTIQVKPYVVDPSPFNALFMYALDDVAADLYVSNVVIGDPNNLTNVTLSTNGTDVAVTGTEVVDGYGNFTGSMLKASFSGTEYVEIIAGLQPGGLLWDTHETTFDLNYDAAGVPGSYSGTIMVRGHMSGDANVDGNVNVGDAVFLIAYIFKHGETPQVMETADGNCDGTCNVADAVRLVNYIFRNGNAPCHP